MYLSMVIPSCGRRYGKVLLRMSVTFRCRFIYAIEVCIIDCLRVTAYDLSPIVISIY